MLESYKWPNMDHADQEPGPAGEDSFRALAVSGAPLAQATALPVAFEDMNDQFSKPAELSLGHEPSEPARAAELLAAHEAGVEQERSLSLELRRGQEAEMENLHSQLRQHQVVLDAHRQHVEKVAKGLMGELMAALGKGRLRIDEAGWREALEALRQALAPEACQVFSSREAPPAELTRGEETFVLAPEVPDGEIHATDGSRTVAVSLHDIAISLKNILFATEPPHAN